MQRQLIFVEPKNCNIDFLYSRTKNFFFRHFRNNNGYALKFHFFQVWNLLNVIANIVLTDYFLGGKFLTYGPQVYSYYMDDRPGNGAMSSVFPKITKCQFNVHGAGGDINVGFYLFDGFNHSCFILVLSLQEKN